MRRSTTVATGVLLSRLSGLARVVAVGYVLGPTVLANIFQVGYALPGLVFTALFGPVLSLVLVPTLVRAVQHAGRPAAQRLLDEIAGRTVLLGVVVGVVLAAAAPLVAHTLTFGPTGSDRARHLATVVVLVVAAQVVLYVLIGLAVAAQQVHGRFGLPAVAPVIENLVLIPVVLVVGQRFGRDQDVAGAPIGLVLAFASASLLAAAVHACVQLAGAARAGMAVRPLPWQPRTPAGRELGSRLARSWPTAVCPAATMYLILAVAATVPGGVYPVQLGITVFYAAIGIGGGAVAVAALPALAASASEPVAAFARGWRRCVRHALTVAVPLTLVIAVGAGPAAELLATGTLRRPWMVGAIAACLCVVAVAQLLGVLRELGQQALFAHHRPGPPARAGAAAFAAALPFAALALTVPAGPSRLVVLTGAIALGEAVAAVMLLRHTARLLRGHPLLHRGDLSPIVLGVLAMTPVLLAVASMSSFGPHPALAPAQLFGCALAVGVYAAVWRRRSHRKEAASRAPTTARRAARARLGVLVPALAAAAAAALHVSLRGPHPIVYLGAAAVLATVAVAAWRPVWACYAYLALVPLVAGIGRGHLVPLLRPNEALLAVLLAGACAGAAWHALRCRGRWPAVRPLDRACALLGLAAVVWPVTWVLLRGRAPEPGELAAVLPVCKLLALYMLVRVAVRTAEQVRRCAAVILCSAGLVALIAVLQTAGWSPVLTLLSAGWALEESPGQLASRGSSTLGSPIATGDVLLVAAALLWCAYTRGLCTGRRYVALGMLLGAGILAAGQFSTWIAAVVVVVALARSSRVAVPAARVTVAVAVVALLGAPAVLGRVQELSSGRLPQSWLGRWDNLSTFYLPNLDPVTVAFGMSPDSVLAAPETWREVIYLESGYLDLIWIGGLPLLAAFGWLAFRVIGAATRHARESGPVGVVGATVAAWWPALLVLTVLDPHLTLRGGGDLAFALLAIVATPARPVGLAGGRP